VFGALLCAGALAAQEEAPPVGTNAATNAAPLAPLYTPLDLKHKYLYSFNETMAPQRWIGFSIHAALDQAEKTPSGWGNGPDSFGVRVASHFGKSLLRENIAFGVRALDHEDPRYFRIGKGSGWNRTKFALTRTFVARRDDGEWMPAYSRFVTSYATPMLIQSWHPEKFSVSRGVRAGSLGVGMGLGSNLWQEFWPDLKKNMKFLQRFRKT
jgi:hypothetical protein